MAKTYSDMEIEAFIAEGKPLPLNRRRRMNLRQKRGHEEGVLDLAGDAGSEFRVILRRNTVNVLDFSIIPALHVPQSTRFFRLRRYNGRSHEHRNIIEGNSFYGFHIHQATERYQEFGTREDAYAEKTDRYGDYDGALRCFMEDMNFDSPADAQPGLFPEG